MAKSVFSSTVSRSILRAPDRLCFACTPFCLLHRAFACPFLGLGISSCHFSPRKLLFVLRNQFRHTGKHPVVQGRVWPFSPASLVPPPLCCSTCHPVGSLASLLVFVSPKCNFRESGAVSITGLQNHISFQTGFWSSPYIRHRTHTVPGIQQTLKKKLFK